MNQTWKSQYGKPRISYWYSCGFFLILTALLVLSFSLFIYIISCKDYRQLVSAIGLLLGGLLDMISLQAVNHSNQQLWWWISQRYRHINVITFLTSCSIIFIILCLVATYIYDARYEISSVAIPSLGGWVCSLVRWRQGGQCIMEYSSSCGLTIQILFYKLKDLTLI